MEFTETHYCTPYAKWGAGSLKALSGGILHSRPVQTAIQVKKSIIVHGLYTHQRLYSFFQLRQAEEGVPILCNSYVLLALLCRISHECNSLQRSSEL